MTLDKYQDGFGPRNRIYWTMTDTKAIECKDAYNKQIEAGKHPEGYGFFNFKCEQIREDYWQASWQCAASTGD